MEISAGLAESNGSLLPGIWRDSLHVSCGLTACTRGSALGPTLRNEYGKTLPFFTLPEWSGTRKVKPILILLKQETVSGSGISWAMCKSAPRSRQITMPAPHRSVFTGRKPFLPPNKQRQSTEGKDGNTDQNNPRNSAHQSSVIQRMMTSFPEQAEQTSNIKVKPLWILMRQESTVLENGRGNGWTKCKQSAPL